MAQQPQRTEAISPRLSRRENNGICSALQSSRRNPVEHHRHHPSHCFLRGEVTRQLRKPKPSPRDLTQKGAIAAWPSRSSGGPPLTSATTSDPPECACTTRRHSKLCCRAAWTRPEVSTGTQTPDVLFTADDRRHLRCPEWIDNPGEPELSPHTRCWKTLSPDLTRLPKEPCSI